MLRPMARPFDLVEHHLRARGDIFLAVDFARQDDADRFRRILAHGVNLPRAGLRAQDQVLLRREERILHVARRMAGREVEQAEVVVVGLYLGRIVDLEAHLLQDVDDLADRLVGRVELAHQRPPPGHRHVDAFCGQRRIHLGLCQRRLPFLQGRLQHRLDLVGRLADQRPFLA